MADAVGAEHAFFSTCGSSLSVKSAMLAVCGGHGRILVGRDAHKSVISGLVLCRGGEINRTSPHCLDRDTVAVTDIDELFKLERGAMQPVRVPGHDATSPAGTKVCEHPPVLRTLLAGVRGEVVVDVDSNNRPPKCLCPLPAVCFLPRNTETSANAVIADPAVDHCRQHPEGLAQGTQGVTELPQRLPVYLGHCSGNHAVPDARYGLFDDRGVLNSVGVVGAFPMATRQSLFTELQPLVTTFDGHPWNWAAHEQGERTPRKNETSRWNAGKDLSFVPLRPERVVEVRYDYMEGDRFRHTTQFVRWRPNREPESCTYEQLDRPVRFDLADVLGSG